MIEVSVFSALGATLACPDTLRKRFGLGPGLPKTPSCRRLGLGPTAIWGMSGRCAKGWRVRLIPARFQQLRRARRRRQSFVINKIGQITL